MIKTPSTPQLPKDCIKGEDLEVYSRELRRVIEHLFQLVYQDFSDGNGHLKVVTAIPTAATLDEGEIVAYQTGSSFTLYTNINGTIVSK